MYVVQCLLSEDQVLNLTENHLQFSGRQSIVAVGREQSVSSYLSGFPSLNPPAADLQVFPPGKDTNRDWARGKIQITWDQGSTGPVCNSDTDLLPSAPAMER